MVVQWGSRPFKLLGRNYVFFHEFYENLIVEADDIFLYNPTDGHLQEHILYILLLLEHFGVLVDDAVESDGWHRHRLAHPIDRAHYYLVQMSVH